jgi:hypothetical protein
MSDRLSNTKNLDAAEATALTTHRSSDGTDHANVVLADTHRGSDGSDHTFIDQDVTSGSTPTLDVTNFTGSAAGIDSDATAHAAADGTSHTYIDQDVTNASSPVFAVTNMTGSAAGLDSDATTHAAATTTGHGKVMGSNATIDMVPGAPPVNNAINLSGSGGNQFLPKEIVFVCTAGASLNGDVTITAGTAAGGTQLLPATPLTGLNAAGLILRIAMTGVMPNIAGNAALDCTVTIADTGGGASGTMTCYVIGEEV